MRADGADGHRHGDCGPISGMWTREWFDEAFTNPVTRQSYGVPDDIRVAAERIVSAYGIRGICDPMWIANVIARETGRGDGEHKFWSSGRSLTQRLADAQRKAATP